MDDSISKGQRSDPAAPTASTQAPAAPVQVPARQPILAPGARLALQQASQTLNAVSTSENRSPNGAIWDRLASPSCFLIPPFQPPSCDKAKGALGRVIPAKKNESL